MEQKQAHIIIVDGPSKSGKKLFGLELAITLMYNKQKTALLLDSDSPLNNIINSRITSHQFLPTPTIINKDSFVKECQNFDAIIIPGITNIDDLAINADTYITLLTPQTAHKFPKNTIYLNNMWELKKKIASTHNKTLNWVICENNLKDKSITEPSKELSSIARMYGFRVAPPINKRASYLNTFNGISSQDKTYSNLKNNLTYEDICAKREITKLAEFIFS